MLDQENVGNHRKFMRREGFLVVRTLQNGLESFNS